MLVKGIKNRRKLRILLFFAFFVLIVAVVIFFNSSISLGSQERLLDEGFFEAAAVAWSGDTNGVTKIVRASTLVRLQQERVPVVPEKYDENKIKSRIIADKIKKLKERQKNEELTDPDEEHIPLDGTISAVHIFYYAPVQWYKSRKVQHQHQQEQDQQKKGRYPSQELKSRSQPWSNQSNSITSESMHSNNARILNTAFYPALGLYQPTTRLLQQHFENIQNCGIGVLILAHTGKPGEAKLFEKILNMAPSYNLSVTFEFSLSNNQSQLYIRQQLLAIRNLSLADAFYRVYSLSRQQWVPMLYVSQAYKLSDSAVSVFCSSYKDNERKTFDALFVGHIKLRSHADTLRRLCFDGFYSRLPSNGGTFGSTWKNWSYLKSFAQTYKMLFVPTVGPGFAERNKFPRHDDIQRHRSNGRYYGVAWRTAIINHVGFISVASYNNWQDGSQIEEVLPKAGFLDYSPGSKTKYLDLTTHWVGNLWRARREIVPERMSCYELLNNSIC